MSAYFATVRAMSVDQMTMGFSPNVDGVAIAQHPFHPKAAAVSANVPLIVGSTRTELTASADDTAFRLDEAGLRARLGALLGDSTSAVLDVYRKANPDASPSELYFLIASDERYGAPVMKIAERRAALGRGAVYLYYFRWETPLDGGEIQGAAHGRDPVRVPQLEGFALDGRGGEHGGARRSSQRRVARVREDRQSEHAEAAALAGVRREATGHDGIRHAEHGGRRSAARAASRDVRSEGTRELSAPS